MLKNKILPTVALTAICITVALVLALANMLTAPIIEEAQNEKVAKSLRVVYPQGESFESLTTDGRGLPESITEAYAANDGGFVFKASVKGYKSGLVVLVGVNAEGAVTDTKYLESQETNGAENKIDGAYRGQTADSLETVLVSGSTKTSNGYRQAVEDALSAYELLKGESEK